MYKICAHYFWLYFYHWRYSDYYVPFSILLFIRLHLVRVWFNENVTTTIAAIILNVPTMHPHPANTLEQRHNFLLIYYISKIIKTRNNYNKIITVLVELWHLSIFSIIQGCMTIQVLLKCPSRSSSCNDKIRDEMNRINFNDAYDWNYLLFTLS